MATIAHLMLSLVVQSNNIHMQYQTFHDLYKEAKSMWNQQNYVQSYRLFYYLEKSFQYQPINCAWYQIHCLIRLGYWRHAANRCFAQTKRYPTQPQWYLLLSDIYFNQHNYRLAHDILSEASLVVSDLNESYAEIEFQKRVAYEANYRQHQTSLANSYVLHPRLPYDILFHIFDYLDLKSLVRSTSVCKVWRQFLISTCPHLWSKLEFTDNKTKYIGSSTINSLLDRLGSVSLKKLSINQQQADGDGILLTLLQRADHCRNLNTLVLSNILVSTVVFFNALEYIGPKLVTLEWGGVSLWLNELMDHIPRTCTQLKHLLIHDCFASLYPKENVTTSFVLSSLETLQLSNIHGLKPVYLAQTLSHCPNLLGLTLNKSGIGITAVLDIMKTIPLEKLNKFHFERNIFSHVEAQKMTTDDNQLLSKLTNWKELRIQSDSGLEDLDLEYMLTGAHHTLVTLDLRGCMRISDNGLLLHQHYTQLKTLCLRECFGITSDGILTILSHCPLLEKVDLSHLSTITDDILMELSNKKCLKYVDLTNCKQLFKEDSIKLLVKRRKHTLQKIKFTHCSLALLYFTIISIKSDII